MKMAKLIDLFAVGFLALLLAGCFNPITVIPPKTAENPLAEPFSVDILIGEAPEARSIAGPDASRIKDDIRNIIQLIVVDNSGTIAAFDEVRRGSNNETVGELRIEAIPFNETYHFLLLMGHWERNYGAEQDGNWMYKEDKPPTLLAAGLKEQKVTGSGTVTVTMWPIVIDTEFTGPRTIGPVVNAGKPEAVSLLPVDWNVKWTIKRGNDGNGLTDLVKAQKIPVPGAGEALLLRSAQTLVRAGTDTWSNETIPLSGNSITRSINDYTSSIQKIGTGGSVNFKLEYVPFNLTGAGAWSRVDESVFNLSAGGPVWIIRNGVNDLAQDGNTDFTSFHHIVGGVLTTPNANGNGAVRYGIAADEPEDPNNPQPGDLVIRNGAFEGPAGSDRPKIAFTTEGYTETAEAYYAVVGSGSAVPGYSAYTGSLGSFAAGTYTGQQIELPGTTGYDVYVRLFKDGKVSGWIKISTTSGGGGADWIWGDEPYLGLYVKSDGDDSNTGDKDHPLATVQKALEKLAAGYTSTEWPGKGTSEESPGAIIILDTVEVTQQINITGDTGYPPIILCDDPETSGGKLQATAAIPEQNCLLSLRNGVDVTLSGGLILAGIGQEGKIRGVYVYSSSFTMTGGEISNNSAMYNGSFAYGGGVNVYGSSTFIMTGGKISDNFANNGGGVWVDGSMFTMTGGEISGNQASSSSNSGLGGGVYVSSSTFIMDGGVISGNQASSSVSSGIGHGSGGGVYIGTSSTFIMDGGVISGNQASPSVSSGISASFGGGVYIGTSSTFTMNNGKISGNQSIGGGGVYVYTGNVFTMHGGEISGNQVSSTGGGVSTSGTFTMDGGVISGNFTTDASPSTIGQGGGGVHVSGLTGSARFTKTGGTIYGYSVGDPVNSNTVKNSGGTTLVNTKGHAVFVFLDAQGSNYRKETTSGPEDQLFYNDLNSGTSGWVN